MPEPLNVYTFVPQQTTISYDYRIMTTVVTARELGLPVKFHVDTNIEGVSPEERVKNFTEADIVLMYQPVGFGPLHNMRVAKSFMPTKRPEGWKYPPTFITDTDDNLFRVDPHNPAYKNLGWCDPETGKEIPKGHQIAELVDGVRHILWQDGHNDFSVERNKQTLDTYRQIINESDCVTCTTPRNAEYVHEHSTPRRVEVFPNLVRSEDYPQIDLMPNNRIKILWQGGQNHEMDWRPLKNALRNISKKYPDVQWITWGVNYPWVTEVIPADRLTFMPWCDWREYKLRRVMVGEDISLAPLTPNRFNLCRSAIKFYEASMGKRPAVTLAQKTGPYADEIQDAETGLLFETPEEFEDRLSLLIENSTERTRLGANAKDWVNEQREAKRHVPAKIKFYEELRAEAPKTQPHMSDSAWERFEAAVKAQAEAEAQKASATAQA